MLYQWYPACVRQPPWESQGYSKGAESSHDFTASLPASQGLVLLLFSITVVVKDEIVFLLQQLMKSQYFCNYVFSNLTQSFEVQLLTCGVCKNFF